MRTGVKIIDKRINEGIQKFIELGRKENYQQLSDFLEEHSLIRPQVRGIEFKRTKRISGILQSRIYIDINPNQNINSKNGIDGSYICIDIDITSALNIYFKYEYMICGGTGFVCSDDGIFEIRRKDQNKTKREMIENIYNTAIELSKSNPKIINYDRINPIKIFTDYIDNKMSSNFIKHITKDLNEEHIANISNLFFSYPGEEDHYNTINSFKREYNYEKANLFSLSDNIKFIKAFKRLEDHCINFVYRNSFGLFKPTYSNTTYLLENTNYHSKYEFNFEPEYLLPNEIVIMNRKSGYEKDRYIYDNEKLIVIAADNVFEFENGYLVCINGETGILSPEFIALIQLLDY
jgi:hypothetical protein